MQFVAGRDRKLARLTDRNPVQQFVRDGDKLPANLDENAQLQNARQFAFRARFGITDFLVEYDDGLQRIKMVVAFLRVCKVELVERLNRCVICAKQSLCLELIAHA